MNILEFEKMNICFEWIFWIFIKWIIFWINILVLVCPHQKWLSPNVSGIISGTYFSPFQGVFYLYRGLRTTQKPYFDLVLEFGTISLIFYEWIILLNILDSIEWIFFWMNISDFVLNWIIFRPNSMKKGNFQNVSNRAIQRRGLVF